MCRPVVLFFCVVQCVAVMGKLELFTENEVKYTFFPYSNTSIHFKVKAGNDVHVGLTTGPSESDPMIEVVIGGWSNTNSVIRRRFRTIPEKVTIETPGIVSAGDFRGFWVRWDAGVISVGRESEEVPFMSWPDPDPFHVTYVGVHTGFGATGNWIIEDRPSAPKTPPRSSAANSHHEVSYKELRTEDDVKYKFFSHSKNFINFKVKAANDVHVGLTKGPQEFEPMIEVVIGGWGNTKSVIRRRFRNVPEKFTVETPRILDASKFRGFWVRWDDGVIEVGREGADVPFMSWADPDPFDVTHVGVHTGFGSTGSWKIEEPSSSSVAASHNSASKDTDSACCKCCHKTPLYYTKDVRTEDDTKYTFFPYSKESVNFKVKAANDVHIGLTSGPEEADPMVEIVFGGWTNTKSVIRRRFKSDPEKVSVETPGILKAEEFRGFWVRWDRGVILVGREHAVTPFMSWEDREPFHVTHIGVHTGFGATGSWKIEDPSSAPAEGALSNSAPDDVVDSLCCKCCRNPLPLTYTTSAPAFTNKYTG